MSGFLEVLWDEKIMALEWLGQDWHRLNVQVTKTGSQDWFA